MTRIFISYRFTGEDPQERRTVLRNLTDTLESARHKIFCSLWESEFFEREKYDAAQIYEYCLKKQKEYDLTLGLVKSEDHSQGMEGEAGNSLALHQPYVLAIRRGLDFPHFREIADHIIEFDEYSGLYTAVRRFDFDDVINRSNAQRTHLGDEDICDYLAA